jgi:hypothetical protein
MFMEGFGIVADGKSSFKEGLWNGRDKGELEVGEIFPSTCR